MAKVDFKLTENFDGVERAMTKSILLSLKGIGQITEGRAKKLAPVDSGRLRQSIDNNVNTKKQYVDTGTDVEYAEYVEKGTSRQDAQPYLEPAVFKSKREIKKLVESIFKQVMK